MRVGLFIISAFSASAGVAVAQSDWVVDPWSSHATTPPEQSSIATLADAAHPALEPRRAYNQHREWLNEWSAEPADPWTGDAATAPGLAHPPAEPVLERATRDSGDWAKPVPLLVDPWATEPARSAAPVVDLIVDPWAHE